MLSWNLPAETEENRGHASELPARDLNPGAGRLPRRTRHWTKCHGSLKNDLLVRYLCAAVVSTAVQPYVSCPKLYGGRPKLKAVSWRRWHCVIRYVGTDVSAEQTASSFRVQVACVIEGRSVNTVTLIWPPVNSSVSLRSEQHCDIAVMLTPSCCEASGDTGDSRTSNCFSRLVGDVSHQRYNGKLLCVMPQLHPVSPPTLIRRVFSVDTKTHQSVS
jgi:hypothetical protein